MTLLAYVRRLTFSATATWSEKPGQEQEEISSEMGVMGAWVRKERRENRRKRAGGIGKPKTPSHLHPLLSWCTEALRWSVPGQGPGQRVDQEVATQEEQAGHCSPSMGELERRSSAQLLH